MAKHGILVCGHGSRKAEGIKGLIDLSGKIQSIRKEEIVSYCFLDLSSPDFSAATKKMYEQGVRHLIVAPAFLFGGIHANFELPSRIDACHKEFPDLEIVLANLIGTSKFAIEACCSNVNDSEKNADLSRRDKHCLLTVGAGTSIVGANAEMAKLTRIVWESCGFGFALYSFISNATFPNIKHTFDIIGNSEYSRIVVLPVLFFPGVYIDKIYLATEYAKEKYGKEIVIAEPLGNSNFLVEAMLEAIASAQA